jgi:hypothetical protein
VTSQNGGGGGGVGRMRFNTYAGQITGNATLSPDLTTATTTQGQAVVQ